MIRMQPISLLKLFLLYNNTKAPQKIQQTKIVVTKISYLFKAEPVYEGYITAASK